MYKDTVILIPAYNPSDVLVSLVRNLVRYKFLSIVVVNDGSDVISRDIFISLDNIKNCIVLRNDRNSGKGFSLKVGFKYILENFNCSGVLTVDSDGQHDLDSILKVSSFTHLKND
jgi:glycosyltransferase involved in cell wall biosynthesis